MSSAIDATKPIDNELAKKSDQRDNWTAAKNEIQLLQLQVAVPRLMAFDTSKFKNV